MYPQTPLPALLPQPFLFGEPIFTGKITIHGEQLQSIAALRRGNTNLIEALMLMVQQFFIGHDTQGRYDEDGEVLTHRHMSCEETAIEVLVAAGFAEVIEPKKMGWRLRWDLLDKRKEADAALAAYVEEINTAIPK